MMPDFAAIKRGEQEMNEIATAFGIDDLRRLTEASIASLAAMLDGLIDADVTFVPDDPQAHDGAAIDPGERGLAWTLGHVIAHTTASGEEYAAVASEFARGVPFHGRPRYETPWQQVRTIADCQVRLEESQRIRVASLDMWPDLPHLDVGTIYWSGSGWVNAKGIFVWGLAHDVDHYRQVSAIREQAIAARA